MSEVEKIKIVVSVGKERKIGRASMATYWASAYLSGKDEPEFIAHEYGISPNGAIGALFRNPEFARKIGIDINWHWGGES